MRLIRMEYKGMLTSPLSVMSTAVLKETDGSRHCLMTFSKDLAGAIQACQKRTMVQGALITHRHMVDLLTEAGWLIHHLIIPRTVGERFQTVLYFQAGNRSIGKDMLPSDALAFALYVNCPIYINQELLAQLDDETDESTRITLVKMFGSPTNTQAAVALALNDKDGKLPQA